jgi:hypothetical protein
MKVPDLLRAAQDLLADPDPDTSSVWPRGVAILTRQAIEAPVDAYWRMTVPAMQDATATEQWLALPCYLGRDPTIPAAEYSWSALSEACHQRAYDVGLTEAELRTHIEAADALRALVAAAITARAAHPVASP